MIILARQWRADQFSVARGISTIDRRIRQGDAVTKLDGWTGRTLQGTILGVIGEPMRYINLVYGAS